ncbi:uncharacterized protein LOC115919766 isoform X1 [Strongylocentrotus purpuratus]|uniref:Uncharacterized protein n=1 Tax=Strongylocentrotus purpuratus TaxID=7668 RepID=A0A7M7N2R0_STRPU|nr:uncharacterized protein LOC115919766 isoform X1 [Strongylocentrotus purpuratus]
MAATTSTFGVMTSTPVSSFNMLNTPPTKRVPANDFAALTRPSYNARAAAASPPPPLTPEGLPGHILAMKDLNGEGKENTYKDAIFQLEQELENTCPFEPTPSVTAPSPSCWAPRRELERPNHAGMDTIKKVLRFDDDDVIFISGDEEEEEAVEEGEIISVVQPSQRRDISDQLPVAPVLMAVKALSARIHTLVVEGCQGCQDDQPGQEAHLDCLYQEWHEKVDTHFIGAINRLNEKEFLDFLPSVYNTSIMFDDEMDEALAEAVEFFHFDFQNNDVREFIKTKMMKQ